jgi:hypothetical protein
MKALLCKSRSDANHYCAGGVFRLKTEDRQFYVGYDIDYGKKG